MGTEPRPYQPVPALIPATRPAVWSWYVAYAIAMAVLYVFVLFVGAFLAIAVPEGESKLEGIVMVVVGLPLCGMYVAAPFLAKRPGAWTYHLVLICIGLTSACCMPAAIPLLIHWLKPETKRFFGRV